jgi:hypothetical protein
MSWLLLTGTGTEPHGTNKNTQSGSGVSLQTGVVSFVSSDLQVVSSAAVTRPEVPTAHMGIARGVSRRVPVLISTSLSATMPAKGLVS